MDRGRRVAAVAHRPHHQRRAAHDIAGGEHAVEIGHHRAEVDFDRSPFGYAKRGLLEQIRDRLGIETQRTNGTLFEGRVPALGSHYAFELHEPSEGKFAVRLTFNSDAGRQVISIPGCDGEMCSLDRFLELAAEIAPEDWRKACGG